MGQRTYKRHMSHRISVKFDTNTVSVKQKKNKANLHTHAVTRSHLSRSCLVIRISRLRKSFLKTNATSMSTCTMVVAFAMSSRMILLNSNFDRNPLEANGITKKKIIA